MSEAPKVPSIDVSVKDLAGIGSAGEKIIDAISGAIGTLYRPTSIRKDGRAMADAEAYRIEKRAMAEAKARLISEDAELTIEARAANRLRAQEVRRQVALEATVDEAVARSGRRPKATGRALDEDWTNAFITHAQEISGEELRAIWARILADQATDGAPEVSRATLDSVRLLEPSMARQFEAAIRMWAALGQIMHLDDSPDGMMNLHSPEMMALEDIGLLKRIDRDEPNLEFTDGVVLSFFDGADSFWGTPQPLPRDGKLEGRLTSRRVRLDRMIPTWRGQELAAVLVEGLHVAMMSGDYETIAPGYGTHDIRLGYLTDWAAQISDRGYIVVLNVLEKAEPGADGAVRNQISPKYVMRDEGEEWQWDALSELEATAIRDIRSA